MGSVVFYPGSNELATVSNTFSVNGTPTDPTTVTLVVTSPTGTEDTYTQADGDFTHSSTGVYSIDIACTEAGTWSYEWTGTGAASDVQAGTWTVTQAPGSDLYCTPEVLKSRTGISDSLDDAEILTACRSVSRWIDEHCDRVFARRSVTLALEADGPYAVCTPDLVSVTTLKTDNDGDGVYEVTWGASDYELQPVNAAVQIQPMPYTAVAAVGSQTFPIERRIAQYMSGRRLRVQIVGVFGWPSIPAPVAEAAAILATDYLAAGGTKFGVIGFEGFAMRARQNPLALSMLAAYRKYPVLIG